MKQRLIIGICGAVTLVVFVVIFFLPEHDKDFPPLEDLGLATPPAEITPMDISAKKGEWEFYSRIDAIADWLFSSKSHHYYQSGDKELREGLIKNISGALDHAGGCLLIHKMVSLDEQDFGLEVRGHRIENPGNMRVTIRVERL